MAVLKQMIRVRGLEKTFVLHNQGGVRLPVLRAVDFDAAAGECLALAGPSGTGKSTLLRCLYGNYLATAGSIRIRDAGAAGPGAAGDAGAGRVDGDGSSNDGHGDGQWIELHGASEQRILQLRRDTIGYVSQFLHAVPRVGALDVVAEPLRARGVAAGPARERAAALLARLNLPARLFDLPPATFSGGEQQRVNIARGLIGGHPVLLLDEPTASLDARNRDVVVELLCEAVAGGRCLVGIFHDEAVRDAVATRVLALEPAAAAAEPALQD